MNKKESKTINLGYNWIPIIVLLLYLCVVFSSVSFVACSKSVDSDTYNKSNLSTSKNAYPDSFKPNDKKYSYVGIPRIVIETENRTKIEDRVTEIPAKMQIWGEKETETEILDLTIRGRGNSTWWYPKKPYAIKLEKKYSLLGMPKAKKWVLLANYRDRTLMRNALAFEIARQTDIGWTPQGRFVEVFINDDFVGTYFLCEKIQVQENRLSFDDDSYLLELDISYDADFKFKSLKRNLPINVKNPKELSDLQFSYIKSYIDTVETILYDSTFDSLNLENYIDFKSFALYWIIYEIAKNGEPNHPKSVYMYKQNGGLLKMGPVWDFDFTTFSYSRELKNQKSLWYAALRKNPDFEKLVKILWNQHKDFFVGLTSFVDSLASYTKEANERNISLWPISVGRYSSGDEELDYDSAIQMLKKNYMDRINVLDSLFMQI